MENIKTSNIKNIKAVIIDNSLDENVNSKNCVSELLIEYEDGKAEILDSDFEDIEKREELTKLFNRCCRDSSLKINIGKVETNGTTQQVLQDSENIQLYKVSDAKRLEEYDEAVGNYENLKQHSKVKKYMTMAGIALGVAGAVAGCEAIQSRNNEDTVMEEEQETVEEIVKPDMEGQEWDYYVENAIDNIQKESWSTVGDFLLSFNNSQEWMERTNENGEFSRFGFAPEETMATYLRFNEFTDEELITIFNGTNINADEIMNLSNDFIEKMITYYTVSDEVSNVEQLFNDSHDKEVIKAFEEHHTKMMKAEGKEKEELMREEKQMFSDYFNSDVEGKETRARQGSTSYLLRTMLLSDSIIASMNNYEGTIVLDAIGSNKQVNAKTVLFDDVFMATFIGGFDDFKEENVIKNLGYDPNKYTIILDDVNRSIADMSCGEQEQKFRDADEYKITLETSEKVVNDNRKALEAELTVYVDKDGKIDADKVAEAIDNMNFNSEEATIAELTKYSYEPSLIADMLSKKLETLEKNAVNANTFMELVEKIQIEALNKLDSNKSYTNSSSSTKNYGTTTLKNDTTKDEKEEHNAAVNELINRGASAQEAEKMTSEAEKEGAHKDGKITTQENQEKEEEAEQKTIDLIQMYNAVYNHYAEEKVYETNLAYDASWAYSSDKLVRDNYNRAKSQGLELKQARAAAKEELRKQEEERKKAEEELEKKKQELEGGKVIQETPTPTPEETPAPTEAPVETPTPSGDYAPIVDEPAEPSQTPEIWDEDKLIEQFSLDNVEAYSSDFSSMEVYANDLVQEESTQKTL